MRRVDDVQATRLGRGVKAWPVLGIVVTDQMLDLFTQRRGLAQLLSHPGIGRVARGVNMHHAPRTQMEHHKGMDRLEEQGDNGHEVTDPDVLAVGLQEGGPRRPGRGR